MCDGQPQCNDLSDDWDCYNFTTIETPANNMTSTDDTITNSNALQIKKTNGKFAFVCYDNWNLNYANLICNGFGFARSINYESIEIDATNVSLVRINDIYQQETSMLTNLNETTSCDGNKIVALECEKYGKHTFCCFRELKFISLCFFWV